MLNDNLINFMELLTLTAYAFALVAHLYYFFWQPGEKTWGAWSFGIFSLAVILHTLFLIATVMQLGFFPFHLWIASVSFIAWAIAVGFAYLKLATKDRRMGVFIVPVVFAFQLLSMVSSEASETMKELPERLHSSWYGIHVGVSLFACSAFSLSGCFSLSYLLLSQEIRLKRLRFFFRRMPPLGDLERMNHRIILFGFLLLTVAIASGMVWMLQLRGTTMASPSDFKLIPIVIMWLLYGALIHLRYRQGWQGARTALFAFINFLVMLIVVIIIGFLGTSFHSNWS